MAGHIQVFALSRWLAVTLPVEYYEFARALRWSIPYFSLPWKTGHTHSGSPAKSDSYGSKIHEFGIFSDVQHKTIIPSKKLQPDEYIKYFEVGKLYFFCDFLLASLIIQWIKFVIECIVHLQNNSGPEPVSDG